MKKLLGVFLLLAATVSYAADTTTLTGPTTAAGAYGDYTCVKLYWKGDDSDCTKTDVTIPIPQSYNRLVLAVTDPGTTAPADNYDITLEDSEGTDVMAGGLLNRDTANTESAAPLASGVTLHGGRPLLSGNLTMKFTNTTNADCDGEVFLFFEK